MRPVQRSREGDWATSRRILADSTAVARQVPPKTLMNMSCSAVYHDHRCIYTVLSLKKAEENIEYTKETVGYTEETIGYSVYLYTWYIYVYPKGDLDIDLYTMFIYLCR